MYSSEYISVIKLRVWKMKKNADAAVKSAESTTVYRKHDGFKQCLHLYIQHLNIVFFLKVSAFRWVPRALWEINGGRFGAAVNNPSPLTQHIQILSCNFITFLSQTIKQLEAPGIIVSTIQPNFIKIGDHAEHNNM